jgi:alkanesulfonate monooxygenase
LRKSTNKIQHNNNEKLKTIRYWVPNVSGGLVISKIPQRTQWDYESNVRYAQTAENVGFEYALTQIRFMAGYGAVSHAYQMLIYALEVYMLICWTKDNQHESVSFSQALLHQTQKLNVIAALLPGPW